jgi:hypothetical protein
MGYEEDAPRLSEIGRHIGSIDRKIDDFRNEVRQALNDKVSKETYDAQRQAQSDRITALELTIRNANARFWGGFGTLAVALVLAILKLNA